MSNLHKSKRKVLKINRFECDGRKVIQVIWCVVSKQTARTIYSDHIGVSSYVNGVKNYGISGYLSKKPINVVKADLSRQYKESLQQAWYNSLRGVTRQGIVAWYDSMRGEGMVRDVETGKIFVLYACNTKKSTNPYPEMNHHVKFTNGEQITFVLGDFHEQQCCGVTQVEKVA